MFLWIFNILPCMAIPAWQEVLKLKAELKQRKKEIAELVLEVETLKVDKVETAPAAAAAQTGYVLISIYSCLP